MNMGVIGVGLWHTVLLGAMVVMSIVLMKNKTL